MANIGELKFGISFERCDECKYKREASIRDNLLVTAGARAAYMHNVDSIDIPEGTEGEHELAMFIAKTVDYYLDIGWGNFDLYIESALMKKYGGNHENMG